VGQIKHDFVFSKVKIGRQFTSDPVIEKRIANLQKNVEA
jgi:hypothetical protein